MYLFLLISICENPFAVAVELGNRNAVQLVRQEQPCPPGTINALLQAAAIHGRGVDPLG